MQTSRANVNTASASSYLRKLCQYWSHKFPVEFSDEQGTIQLPQSTCVLNASPELLTIRLTMEDGADAARLRTVVEEHLQRFGFREELENRDDGMIDICPQWPVKLFPLMSPLDT